MLHKWTVSIARIHFAHKVKRADSSVVWLALEPEEKTGTDCEHQGTPQTEPSEFQPQKFRHHATIPSSSHIA